MEEKNNFDPNDPFNVNWNNMDEQSLYEKMIYKQQLANQFAFGSSYALLHGDEQRARAWEAYMQQVRWNYDKPSAQMARLREAGLNPYTAAMGIAGGNQSAVQPTEPIGSSAMDNIGGAVGAAGHVANLGSQFAKLGSEISNIDSQTVKNLEDAGLSHYQALAAAAVLPYVGYKEFANIMLMLAEYDVKSQEYNIALEEYEGVKKETKLKQQEIEKNKILLNVMEYQEQMSELDLEMKKNDKYWSDFRKKFFQDNGYLLPNDSGSLDSVAVQLYGNGKSLHALGKELENFYKRVNKGRYAGQYEADKETVYDRRFEFARGQYAADSQFGENAEYYKNKGRARAESESGRASTWAGLVDKTLSSIMSEGYSWYDIYISHGLFGKYDMDIKQFRQSSQQFVESLDKYYWEHKSEMTDKEKDDIWTMIGLYQDVPNMSDTQVLKYMDYLQRLRKSQ